MRFFLPLFSIFFMSIGMKKHLKECEAKCPQYFRFQLQCASDGSLYPDKCRAQCHSKQNKILFDCGVNPIHKTCSKKCKAYLNSPKPIDHCRSKCPVNHAPQAICASNKKLYTDLCRAKCSSANLEQVFKCPSPLNLKQCRVDCRHFDSKPRPKCSVRGLVCSESGRVFNSECDLLRRGADSLRFRCSENGVGSVRECQGVCALFRLNGDLRRCRDHERAFACFEDGLVRRDWCLPQFWGISRLFLCTRGLGFCKRRCQNQYYWR